MRLWKTILIVLFITIVIIVLTVISKSQGWSNPQGILIIITSGLSAAAVSAILNELSVDRARRAEFIKSQLQDLYGPLKFLIDWNNQLYSHARSISKAYNAEYIEKQYSQNSATQQRLTEASEQTLKSANKYIQRTRENNEDILEILQANYHLLEPDDIESASQFLLDHTRYKVEWGESGIEIPKEIFDHLDNLTDLRPEFVENVTKTFFKKRTEWKNLIRQK